MTKISHLMSCHWYIIFQMELEKIHYWMHWRDHVFREGVSPPSGRTHPYSGWLFKEKVPLIPLQSKWDHDIHIELHRRFQQ